MNQNDFSAFSELMRMIADYYRVEMKPGTVRLYWNALSGYELEVVKRLLNEHVQASKFMPTIAELLDTLKTMDGRPGVEEAWSICAKSLNDEAVTVVWTQEMAEAFGAALALSNDRIAARMAFKERYESLVKEARRDARPVHWTVSLGHDQSGREGPILEAVGKGRLQLQHAAQLLPNRSGHKAPGEVMKLIRERCGLLPAPKKTETA